MAGPTFPLNAWYAIAWDVEVKRDLLARTICNKPVVLYRKQDGTAVALADACWHRLLPLSMGELYGDNVICGYHGLEFDDTGRCVYMPVAGHHKSVRLRQILSADRAAPVHLALDG